MKRTTVYATVAEAADLLGVSERKLYQAIRSGRLRARTMMVINYRDLWTFDINPARKQNKANK